MSEMDSEAKLQALQQEVDRLQNEKYELEQRLQVKSQQLSSMKKAASGCQRCDRQQHQLPPTSSSRHHASGCSCSHTNSGRNKPVSSSAATQRKRRVRTVLIEKYPDVGTPPHHINTGATGGPGDTFTEYLNLFSDPSSARSPVHPGYRVSTAVRREVFANTTETNGENIKKPIHFKETQSRERSAEVQGTSHVCPSGSEVSATQIRKVELPASTSTDVLCCSQGSGNPKHVHIQDNDINVRRKKSNWDDSRRLSAPSVQRHITNTTKFTNDIGRDYAGPSTKFQKSDIKGTIPSKDPAAKAVPQYMYESDSSCEVDKTEIIPKKHDKREHKVSERRKNHTEKHSDHEKEGDSYVEDIENYTTFSVFDRKKGVWVTQKLKKRSTSYTREGSYANEGNTSHSKKSTPDKSKEKDTNERQTSHSKKSSSPNISEGKDIKRGKTSHSKSSSHTSDRDISWHREDIEKRHRHKSSHSRSKDQHKSKDSESGRIYSSGVEKSKESEVRRKDQHESKQDSSSKSDRKYSSGIEKSKESEVKRKTPSKSKNPKKTHETLQKETNKSTNGVQTSEKLIDSEKSTQLKDSYEDFLVGKKLRRKSIGLSSDSESQNAKAETSSADPSVESQKIFKRLKSKVLSSDSESEYENDKTETSSVESQNKLLTHRSLQSSSESSPSVEIRPCFVLLKRTSRSSSIESGSDCTEKDTPKAKKPQSGSNIASKLTVDSNEKDTPTAEKPESDFNAASKSKVEGNKKASIKIKDNKMPTSRVGDILGLYSGTKLTRISSKPSAETSDNESTDNESTMSEDSANDMDYSFNPLVIAEDSPEKVYLETHKSGSLVRSRKLSRDLKSKPAPEKQHEKYAPENESTSKVNTYGKDADKSSIEVNKHGKYPDKCAPEKESASKVDNHGKDPDKCAPEKESASKIDKHRKDPDKCAPEKESASKIDKHGKHTDKCAPEKESASKVDKHGKHADKSAPEKESASKGYKHGKYPDKCVPEKESSSKVNKHGKYPDKCAPEKESASKVDEHRKDPGKCAPEKESTSKIDKHGKHTDKCAPEKESASKIDKHRKDPSKCAPEKESTSKIDKHRKHPDKCAAEKESASKIDKHRKDPGKCAPEKESTSKIDKHRKHPDKCAAEKELASKIDKHRKDPGKCAPEKESTSKIDKHGKHPDKCAPEKESSSKINKHGNNTDKCAPDKESSSKVNKHRSHTDKCAPEKESSIKVNKHGNHTDKCAPEKESSSKVTKHGSHTDKYTLEKKESGSKVNKHRKHTDKCAPEKESASKVYKHGKDSDKCASEKVSASKVYKHGKDSDKCASEKVLASKINKHGKDSDKCAPEKESASKVNKHGKDSDKCAPEKESTSKVNKHGKHTDKLDQHGKDTEKHIKNVKDANKFESGKSVSRKRNKSGDPRTQGAVIKQKEYVADDSGSADLRSMFPIAFSPRKRDMEWPINTERKPYSSKRKDIKTVSHTKHEGRLASIENTARSFSGPDKIASLKGLSHFKIPKKPKTPVCKVPLEKVGCSSDNAEPDTEKKSATTTVSNESVKPSILSKQPNSILKDAIPPKPLQSIPNDAVPPKMCQSILKDAILPKPCQSILKDAIPPKPCQSSILKEVITPKPCQPVLKDAIPLRSCLKSYGLLEKPTQDNRVQTPDTCWKLSHGTPESCPKAKPPTSYSPSPQTMANQPVFSAFQQELFALSEILPQPELIQPNPQMCIVPKPVLKPGACRDPRLKKIENLAPSGAVPEAKMAETPILPPVLANLLHAKSGPGNQNTTVTSPDTPVSYYWPKGMIGPRTEPSDITTAMTWLVEDGCAVQHLEKVYRSNMGRIDNPSVINIPKAIPSLLDIETRPTGELAAQIARQQIDTGVNSASSIRLNPLSEKPCPSTIPGNMYEREEPKKQLEPAKICDLMSIPIMKHTLPPKLVSKPDSKEPVPAVRLTYPVKASKILHSIKDEERLLLYFSLGKKQARALRKHQQQNLSIEKKRLGAEKPVELVNEDLFGGRVEETPEEESEEKTDDASLLLSPRTMETLWEQGVDVTNPEMVKMYLKMSGMLTEEANQAEWSESGDDDEDDYYFCHDSEEEEFEERPTADPDEEPRSAKRRRIDQSQVDDGLFDDVILGSRKDTKEPADGEDDDFMDYDVDEGSQQGSEYAHSPPHPEEDIAPSFQPTPTSEFTTPRSPPLPTRVREMDLPAPQSSRDEDVATVGPIVMFVTDEDKPIESLSSESPGSSDGRKGNTHQDDGPESASFELENQSPEANIINKASENIQTSRTADDSGDTSHGNGAGHGEPCDTGKTPQVSGNNEGSSEKEGTVVDEEEEKGSVMSQSKKNIHTDASTNRPDGNDPTSFYESGLGALVKDNAPKDSELDCKSTKGDYYPSPIKSPDHKEEFDEPSPFYSPNVEKPAVSEKKNIKDLVLELFGEDSCTVEMMTTRSPPKVVQLLLTESEEYKKRKQMHVDLFGEDSISMMDPAIRFPPSSAAVHMTEAYTADSPSKRVFSAIPSEFKAQFDIKEEDMSPVKSSKPDDDEKEEILLEEHTDSVSPHRPCPSDVPNQSIPDSPMAVIQNNEESIAAIASPPPDHILNDSDTFSVSTHGLCPSDVPNQNIPESAMAVIQNNEESIAAIASPPPDNILNASDTLNLQIPDTPETPDDSSIAPNTPEHAPSEVTYINNPEVSKQLDQNQNVNPLDSSLCESDLDLDVGDSEFAIDPAVVSVVIDTDGDSVTGSDTTCEAQDYEDFSADDCNLTIASDHQSLSLPCDEEARTGNSKSDVTLTDKTEEEGAHTQDVAHSVDSRNIKEPKADNRQTVVTDMKGRVVKGEVASKALTDDRTESPSKASNVSVLSGTEEGEYESDIDVGEEADNDLTLSLTISHSSDDDQPKEIQQNSKAKERSRKPNSSPEEVPDILCYDEDSMFDTEFCKSPRKVASVVSNPSQRSRGKRERETVDLRDRLSNRKPPLKKRSRTRSLSRSPARDSVEKKRQRLNSSHRYHDDDVRPVRISPQHRTPSTRERDRVDRPSPRSGRLSEREGRDRERTETPSRRDRGRPYQHENDTYDRESPRSRRQPLRSEEVNDNRATRRRR